jgi:hypothetical protein
LAYVNTRKPGETAKQNMIAVAVIYNTKTRVLHRRSFSSVEPIFGTLHDDGIRRFLRLSVFLSFSTTAPLLVTQRADIKISRNVQAA